MSTKLSVSRLIRVSVTLSPRAASAQDISTLLLLTSDPVIDVTQRIREYEDITDIATDFGTTSPAYLAALLWFEQAPQPVRIWIGRWAKTATPGQLICGPLTAANQLVSAWTGIADGKLTFSVDGGAHTTAAINLTGVTSLDGVAAAIDAAIAAWADCAYDPSNLRFVFTSHTTGATSTISFLTAPGSGTDITSMLAGRSTSSGAYVADGIALETAVDAAALFDDRFGQQWYALQMPEAGNAEHLTVAAFIEATVTKHLYGITTAEGGALVSNDTASLAYQLTQLAYKRTFTQWSSHNLYAVASALGRKLTVDYNGNSTAIALMYKQEPGIVAENLTSGQANALKARNANVFAAYDNDTAIIQYGTMASGDFIDTITDIDALAIQVQQEQWNALYTSTTKIPQTDAGAHVLKVAADHVCSRFVTNGVIAPGQWNSDGFGALKNGDFMPTGFYTYMQPMAQQAQSKRATRVAPPMKIAVKMAGAIQETDVEIVVNV